MAEHHNLDGEIAVLSAKQLDQLGDSSERQVQKGQRHDPSFEFRPWPTFDKSPAGPRASRSQSVFVDEATEPVRSSQLFRIWRRGPRNREF